MLGPVGRQAAASRNPERSVRELRRNFDQRNPDGDYLAWMSYVGLKRSLVEDFLARLDKMGMQESVEGRVPLLDAGLAKWSFGVPQALKIGSYEQKALMRRAVAPMLPDYVLAHPKQGFCPPVADWAVSLLPSRIPLALGTDRRGVDRAGGDRAAGRAAVVAAARSRCGPSGRSPSGASRISR